MLALTDEQTLVLLSNVQRFPLGHPEGEEHFFLSLEHFFARTRVPLACLHADFRRAGVGGCAIHALRRRPTLMPSELTPGCAAQARAKGKRGHLRNQKHGPTWEVCADQQKPRDGIHKQRTAASSAQAQGVSRRRRKRTSEVVLAAEDPWAKTRSDFAPHLSTQKSRRKMKRRRSVSRQA